MVKEIKKYWALILGILLLDQATKYLVSYFLKLVGSFWLIKPILSLTYAHNTGAGFNILQNQNFLLIFITIGLIAALIYYFNKFTKKEHLFVSFIIAGAIGNLLNRIFLGHVIDFIDFRFWPVFNFADISVSIGVIGLLYLSFKKE